MGVWIVSHLTNRLNRVTNNNNIFRPNKIKFKALVGTSAKELAGLKAGDIVDFKHCGLLPGSKKPNLPIIYRVRKDESWDGVVGQWYEERGRKPPGTPSLHSHHTTSHPTPLTHLTLYSICSPTTQITSLLGRERKLREVLLGIGGLDEDRPHEGEWLV